MRTASRSARLWTAAALIGIVAGCASEPDATPRHVLPELRTAREGTRVSLSTDVPDPLVAPALDRLEKLELLLDRCFPWLPPPRDRVLVLLIDDEGRFRDCAHAHGVPPSGASAFSCRSGEVVLRFKPEEWGQGPPEGWVQSPRVAPLAEVLFRRRLEATYGASLERTPLEDGCARLFSEAAAHELGEAREASRRTRDDLLDAFLPLFLGAEPVFAKSLLVRGSAAVPHANEKNRKPGHAQAVAYAVARYVVVSGQGDTGARGQPDNGARGQPDNGAKGQPDNGAKDFLDVFAAAAGRPGAAEALAAREKDLATRELGFERWLRGKTESALLDALESEPVAAARWEARSALKLISAVDVEVNDAAPVKERAGVVERARTEVATRRTVRFADEFDASLIQERDHHQPGALEKLVVLAKRVLEERSRGYGHPALEEQKGQLGRALEARFKSL